MRGIRHHTENEYYQALRSDNPITIKQARSRAIDRILEGYRNPAEAVESVAHLKDSELAFYDVRGCEVTAGVVRLATKLKGE